MGVIKLSDLDCCPFCGSEEYYKKCNISGRVNVGYRFDGGEAWNGEMYDYTTITPTSERVYCRECYSYLGNSATNKLGKRAEVKCKELLKNRRGGE